MLALYLFGGEVLKGFAFTMLVGIISGTYSTRVHRRGDRDHVAGPEADEGAGRSPTAAPEARKPARRRAS